MPTKLVVGIVAGLILVALLLGAGIWIGHGFAKPSAPSTDTTVVDNGLVDQIIKISELGTVNFHAATYEVRQHRSGASKINMWADADYDVYLFWQGRVKAGIDLDKAMIAKQNYAAPTASGKRGLITITLPASTILSAEPDAKGFNFFINWVSSTGKAPPDEQKADWANEGVAKLKASATANNILVEATRNAKVILEGYVSMLAYDVKFVDAKPADVQPNK